MSTLGMGARAKVTMQVNLTPTDLPHAKWILPHQLSRWAPQVDEVILTVDLERSPGAQGNVWEERLPGIQALLDDVCAEYPHARVVEVEYSEATAARLSTLFFGGLPLPRKDRRGTAFYAYFHGLAAASHRYVLHMDSDMLYGGEGQGWVAEAVDLLQSREDVLACNPLPGPPTADGRLRSQALEPEPYRTAAFRSPHLSTRVFLVDLDRFAYRLAPLRLLPLSPARRLQAPIKGHPAVEIPERLISAAMTAKGLVRVDFLGDDGGTWSVHPPYRNTQFYERLPELVQAVEIGDMPEGQRGFHDIEDCLVDWSDARTTLPQRMSQHLRLALGRGA